MDIAPIQKVTPVADTALWARASAQVSGTPVATELPPSDTVQQASASHAASHDNPRPASDGTSPVVERNVSIDPTTQQIVFKAINDRGSVVLQLPDQAALRQRAYFKDVEATAEKSAAPGTIERFV